jgi:hypothetical protein
LGLDSKVRAYSYKPNIHIAKEFNELGKWVASACSAMIEIEITLGNL